MLVSSIIFSVILTGVSLAMDAFAVSICDGMVYRNLNKRNGVLIPFTFGVFQAIMPIIGFYIGTAFRQIDSFDKFDHWIAFALLLIIGGKMIIDASKEVYKYSHGLVEEEGNNAVLKKFSITEVLLQGVATSIDALFAGFTLNSMLEGLGGNLQAWAWLSAGIIGVITFIISLTGLLIGKKVGSLFKKKASIAEIIGGCVLVLIGVKILLNGLGVINF